MGIDRRGVLGLTAATVAAPALSLARTSPHELRVGDPLPRFDLLTPGARVYLRSRQQGEQHLPADIWRRETRVDSLDGVPRLRIVQRWDGAGPPVMLAERDSVFELGTFRPMTHVRITARDGVRRVEAFRFDEGGVSGLPGIADNERDAFHVDSVEPMYNFETDLEMLQTLPLASGYSASVPFYHPGGSIPPARYIWAVTGEQRLTGLDGRPMDCWIVQTDYNAPQRPPARFWLSKSTQQVIKQEAATPDGVIHRKLLLAL